MTVIREIPNTVAFTTERLEIRKMTCDEWELFVDNVVFADECLFMFAHEKCEKLLDAIREPIFNNGLNYSIYLPDEDRMIGFMSFCTSEKHMDYNSIAYYIFEAYRRQGYAYEAVSALIEKLLDGTLLGRPTDEILAWVVWNNNSSMKLMEKLGFRGGDYRVFDDGVAERKFRYEAAGVGKTA